MSPLHTQPSTASPPATTAPLAGVRILDLTRLLPGPMCTLHLADLGADVIKIEDLEAGDYTAEPVRTLVNRNKRGLGLNLKSPEGVATLLKLCEQADVLVESFRPGVMERLGVGWAQAAARNPKLVYCSLTGYGQTGPYRNAPGHDMNYCALTGVADQNGAAGQAPALTSLPQADLLGGSMPAVMGILAALYDVARGGPGRHVDIAIADGVLAHAVIPLATVNTVGRSQPAGQSKLTGALPCYAMYQTADGGHLAVAALEPKFWQGFCALLGREDLKDLHSFDDPEKIGWVRAELRQLIAAQSLAWWTDKLAGSDCCVTPVLKLEQALDDPHFQARGMVRPLHGGPAQARQLACPVQMSGFDFEVRLPAPRRGEHTDSVLLAAGYTPEEVVQLRALGAVG